MTATIEKIDPSLRMEGETDIEYWQRQVELALELPDEEVVVPGGDDADDEDEYSAVLKPTSALQPKAVKFAESSVSGMWDPAFMQISRMWADTLSRGWLVEFVPTEGEDFDPSDLERFYGPQSDARRRLDSISVRGRAGAMVPPYTEFSSEVIRIGTPQRQWTWTNISFAKPMDSGDVAEHRESVSRRQTLWFFMKHLGLSPSILDPADPDAQIWNQRTLGTTLNATSIKEIQDLNSEIEKKARSQQYAGVKPQLLKVPEAIQTRPTVVGGGVGEEGLYIDVAPAVGSSIPPKEMSSLNLPTIQRASQYADIRAELSPNGMHARYVFRVRRPEDPSIAGSWSPDARVTPHGGGMSVAHAIKAGWTPRVPLGSSLPGQEILWLDFLKTPHIGVLGGTASGKSWGLLSWITLLGGNFLGQQMVVIDGKESGDFSSLLSPNNAQASGIRGIATTPPEAYMMLKWLVNEFNTRKTIQSALKKRGILDMPFPRLIAVIDEIAYLLDDWPPAVSKDARLMIDQLLKAARGVGIHLILAAQTPRDQSYPNSWLGNLGLRISMGATEDAMLQKKVLGAEDALSKYPEAKSFVATKIKGRGVMNTEDASKGQIVTAFRSSHTWSPNKPLAAAGGADWQREKDVFFEKKHSYTKRFGFDFSDMENNQKPEDYDVARVVNLDDDNFEPIPERAVFDVSAMEYEPWAGNSSVTLAGDV